MPPSPRGSGFRSSTFHPPFVTSEFRRAYQDIMDPDSPDDPVTFSAPPRSPRQINAFDLYSAYPGASASTGNRRDSAALPGDFSIVSPREWDYASAGYDRPEVSPLTPLHPLPPAPRPNPRHLSIAEHDPRIRTGYTPQSSRNNSMATSVPAPPSPSPYTSNAVRSMLMGWNERGSTSGTSTTPITSGGGTSFAFDRALGEGPYASPWRGWTDDVSPRPRLPLSYSILTLIS